MTDTPEPPASGTAIRLGADGLPIVPDDPIVPVIAGDGTGPEIWAAARPVLDAAVERAYGGKRRIRWLEVPAGEKASAAGGDPLPPATVEAIRRHLVALKGPLAPAGPDLRSLNRALRRELDLFAAVRPIHHWKGVPAPVKSPDKVNVVIFREITEDVQAGVEWPAGSEGARRVIAMAAEMGVAIPARSAIGIKPMSEAASKRLIRKAIRFAIDRGLPSVTLVHKGNVMPLTEGAFRDWGYQVAGEEFGEATVRESEVERTSDGKGPPGKIVIKDRIADAMFQQMLFRPADHSVIAVPNLIGDYLCDAVAAQVGGLGLASGAALGDTHALFEVTHGSAAKFAGLDLVNPGSMILAGVLLLDHMGWEEAGGAVVRAVERTIGQKTVTYELERLMEGARRLKCSEFGRAVAANIG